MRRLTICLTVIDWTGSFSLVVRCFWCRRIHESKSRTVHRPQPNLGSCHRPRTGFWLGVGLGALFLGGRSEAQRAPRYQGDSCWPEQRFNPCLRQKDGGRTFPRAADCRDWQHRRQQRAQVIGRVYARHARQVRGGSFSPLIRLWDGQRSRGFLGSRTRFFLFSQTSKISNKSPNEPVGIARLKGVGPE